MNGTCTIIMAQLKIENKAQSTLRLSPDKFCAPWQVVPLSISPFTQCLRKHKGYLDQVFNIKPGCFVAMILEQSTHTHTHTHTHTYSNVELKIE
jgi:hypothetical protein